MLSFRFLGPLEITRDGEPVKLPTQKTSSLLAYLVAFRDRAHSREALADLFWPDAPPQRAQSSLRNALAALRKALPSLDEQQAHAYLLTGAGSVRFNERSAFQLDDKELDDALRRSQAATLDAASAERLRAALSLYRGPFLQGDYEDWVLQEQLHWQDRFLDGVLRLSQYYETMGNVAAMIELCRRAGGMYPRHEQLCNALMRACALQGDRPSALAQYRSFAQGLQEEMNLEPLPETRLLYEQILAGAPIAQQAHIERRPSPQAPPFVGRAPLFERLWRRWAQVKAGTPRLMLVQGEPGIGKTAWLQEAQRRLGGQALCLFSTCAFVPSLSFEPVIQALESGPIPVGQILHEVPQLLRAALLELIPSWAGQRGAGDRAEHWAPQQIQTYRFQALCALFQRLAQLKPVCWMVDNLQWADESTLQWVCYALQRLRCPLLIVASRRVADDGELPLLNAIQLELAAQGLLETLDMPPLSAQESEAFVSYGLMSLPLEKAALAQAMLKLAGGNPLYLGELAKEIVNVGSTEGVVGRDAHWIRLLIGHLPQTVQAVLDGRLRRLSNRGRQLLEAGAVLGSRWSVDFAAAALGKRRSSLIEPLQELLQARLLLEQEDGYALAHDLIREYIYHRLPQGQRQYLHEKAGQFLEECQALQDVNASQIAWHFQHAQRHDRSLPHWLKAATQSFHNNALAEGLGLLKRAEAALKGTPEALQLKPPWLAQTRELFALRARGCALRNDPDGQRQSVEALESLAHASHDPNAQFYAHLHRGHWAQVTERFEEAIAQAEALQSFAAQQGSARYQAAALRQLSWIHERRGDYERALACHEEAARLDPLLPQMVAQVPLPDHGGVLYSYLGKHDRALAHYEQQLEQLESATSPLAKIETLISLGVTLEKLGDYERALSMLSQARELSAQLEDRQNEVVALCNLGSVWWGRGEHDQALVAFTQALSKSKTLRSMRVELAVTINMGTVLCDLDRFDEALRCFDSALEAVRAHRMRDLEVEVYWRKSATLLKLGQSQAALTWSRQAVEQLEAGVFVQNLARAYFTHAQALEAEGQRDAADRFYQKACDEVMERAGRIEQPALRALFLTNVKDHREIIERGASRGAG